MGRGIGRSRWLLGAAASALLGLSGCAILDDFTWKRFDLDDYRTPADPLAVIRTSKDGTHRARALRALREPAANGGSKEDQDGIVSVLVYSAANDGQATCRMAAIDVLRTFRDPRAVEGLKDAYYRAGSFNPEIATVLRCQALRALGETGQPAAVEMLVRVVREPGTEGAEQDREQKLDERRAAARALGQFKQAQVASALVEVLGTEQDVALCACAHESLVKSTGRDLPPDAKTWSDYLSDPAKVKDTATVRNPTVADRLIELTGFR